MTTSESSRSVEVQPQTGKRRCRAIIRILVVAATMVVSLHLSGLLHAFSVHAGSMTPALCLGDQFLMERSTPGITSGVLVSATGRSPGLEA